MNPKLKVPENKKNGLNRTVKAKAYVSVAPNQYYHSGLPQLSHYKLAITFTLDKVQEVLAKQLEWFVKQLSSTEALIENHSDNKSYHFLVFCQDINSAESILKSVLSDAELFSNLDDRQIDVEFLIKKATEYAEKFN